jgi:hypothetical protein
MALGSGIMMAALQQSLQASELHVSPAGNDADPGTVEKPLATMGAAQRAARVNAGKAPVTVWLHKGVYYLPETVHFNAEDSGCTYAAVDGETVVLSGGTRMELKWEPFRDGIMQAKTPKGLAIDQLFVNGRRQIMARYPNYEPGVLPYGGFAADAFSRERAARWSDPAGGFLHAMHKGRWGGFHYRITGKDAKGDVTHEGGWQNNRPSPMHASHRFVENIFEELDAPGEWFHNAGTGTLYFYPPVGMDWDGSVEVVRLRHLVEFKGAKNMTLRGLVFRHAARTFMDTREPLLRSDWTVYRGGAVLFNGAEDCLVADCEFDQLGGNAIFVDRYNRRITISGCDIHDTGGSAVAFVGDPDAVRNPLFQYGQAMKYGEIDKIAGPKTENYPKDCLVDDCLIRGVGTIEKQAAGVQISMSAGITVRHCSIYGASRAGVNIGDGCWGGNVIEFCDVFDTVLETGDHGSFNSWGRDRFWKLNGAPAAELPSLALLDAVKPNIIRNSRWRCDHGWDVDLDDGSSNYEIYNNVFLRGGLKLREGFHRKVWNNIAINGSLHPHVWYGNCGDEVTRNIWMGPYRPAIMPQGKWGKDVDRNLFTTTEADRIQFATNGCDAHSLVGMAQFVNAAKGDFRVKEGSPAFKLGFVNFPMDQFGVRSPRLRSVARTPLIPAISIGGGASAETAAGTPWRGAVLRVLQEGEFSAIGVPADSRGVLVVDVVKKSPAFKDGVRVADYIQGVNGREIRTVQDFLDAMGKVADGKPVKLSVVRSQQAIEYEVNHVPESKKP